MNKDISDILFRSLFCLIFIGLGAEHIFSDELIQRLMPSWVPFKRAASILCGVWLVGWGTLIFLGWHLRLAAIALGSFVVIVTLLVHAPGVLRAPIEISSDCIWIWDILQRSNLAKNLCLLGVCFHLLHHSVGRYSVEGYFKRK